MNDATIRVACSVSRTYLLPLAVVLHSLVERLRPGAGVKLYLIHEDIPPAMLRAIDEIVETEPIVPTAEQRAAAPHRHPFPRQAAYPILLADLLPSDVERVLFLDVDLLVLDDVTALWETQLGDFLLGAVPDGAVPHCSSARGVKGWRELGIPENAVYFNCGVLLIDLPRWRERGITASVHDYLGKTMRVDFLHQEALNAVAWNDWRPIDRRWNLLASLDGRRYQSPPCDAWRDPGIVHYAGRMKPWRGPVGGPFDAPYRAVLGRVAPTFARPPAGPFERLRSWYDRYARNALYPLERALWERRLL